MLARFGPAAGAAFLIPAPALALDHRLPKASSEEDFGLAAVVLFPPKDADEPRPGLEPAFVAVDTAGAAAGMEVK